MKKPLVVTCMLLVLGRGTAMAQDTSTNSASEPNAVVAGGHLADSVAKLGQLLTVANGQIAQLQDDIIRQVLQPPQSFSSVNVKAVDTKALVTFTFPVIGRGQVTVTGPGFTTTVVSEDIGRSHSVIIPNLAPGTKYSAVIEVLKNATIVQPTGATAQGSNPGRANFYPQLVFTTQPAGAPAIPTSITARATGDGFVISYQLSQKAVARASIFSAANGVVGQMPVLAQGAAMLTDAVGIPTEPTSQADSIVVSGLSPMSAFGYQVRFVSEQGKEHVTPLYLIRTTRQPAQVVGPVNIRIDPLRGFVARWRASVKPDMAGITASFPQEGSGTLPVKLPVEIAPSDTMVEVVLPASKILETALAADKTPVITLWMQGPTKARWEQDFTLGVEAKRDNALLANANTATKKLLESIERPNDRRWKWEDWAGTVLKLLPVVLP